MVYLRIVLSVNLGFDYFEPNIFYFDHNIYIYNIGRIYLELNQQFHSEELFYCVECGYSLGRTNLSCEVRKQHVW